MGSIPVPALQVQQPINPLEQFQRLAALRGMLQQQAYQQQMQPLQLQQAQTESQISQQQLKDMQAGQAALIASGGDPDKYLEQLRVNGASPQAYWSAQQNILNYQKAQGEKTKLDLENQSNTFDRVQSLVNTAKTNYQNNPQVAGYAWDQAATLAEQGKLIQPGTISHTLPTNPLAFDTALGLLGFQSKVNEDAYKQAQTRDENAKTFLDQNKAKIILGTPPGSLDPIIDQAAPLTGPLAGLNVRTKAIVNQLLQAGDVEGAKAAMTEMSSQIGRRENETFIQGQENYRSTLMRQVTQANELQRTALGHLDQTWTDPTRGYTQFLSQMDVAKENIRAAKNNDELASAMAPLMTVLGINSFAGLHRISPAEPQAVGTMGTVFRQMNTLFDKKFKGTIPDATATEMDAMMDRLADMKYQQALQSSAYIARSGGLDPRATPIMDRQGNMTTLDQAAGQMFSGGGRAGGTRPPLSNFER